MNLPNKLTVFRIILVPIMVIISLCNIPGDILGISIKWIIVDLIFIIASITDQLDGSIARKNNQITTLQTKVVNLESENVEQKARITSLTSELESAQELSSQYKMIVDTANTLLGLNLKNTDSKEQVENAIKEYIKTSINTNETSIDTSSASYTAGFTAGKNSVDTEKEYNNGYSVGYADGLRAGSSNSSDTSSETIANLTSQVTALSNEKAALQNENTSLSSWVSLLSSANNTLENEKQTLESRNNSLQSQVNSLSRTQSSGTTASVVSSGSSSSTLPTVTASTSSSSGTPSQTSTSGTTSASSTQKSTQNTPVSSNSTTNTQDTVIAGTPVATSGTQHELGYVEQIKKVTKSQSSVPAEGQKADVRLTKLSENGNITLDLNGATYKDATQEQKENAYNIINYYLNNLEKLGDLGDVELKNKAHHQLFRVYHTPVSLTKD